MTVIYTQDIHQAAQTLALGQLLALPTETVYGLGARADDDQAVGLIFEAKGRPADHPLIVHVHGVEQARAFAQEIPEMARRLMDAFWPGPLTVIVPRKPGVAEAAAGGHPTVGLRSPSHPVARALLAQASRLGVPGVAAPSANRFGRVSPTRAAHVLDEFQDGEIPVMILDGGVCDVGIESTIVDCTQSEPVILRPGQITRDQVTQVLGRGLLAPHARSARAAGTLEKHYAPRAVVRVMTAQQIQDALTVMGAGPWPEGLALWLRTPFQRPPAPPALQRLTRWMPDRPDAAAQVLFSTLRELDDAGARLIWVETPPTGVAWEGVRDRLTRAAASA